MGDFAVLEFLFGITTGVVLALASSASIALLAIRASTKQKEEKQVEWGRPDADPSNN